MPKKHHPKRGSLAYLPRARASHPTGRIRNWPKYDGPPTILGFVGYKAGMTHVVLIENNPNSPYYGHEITKGVTILEAPPIYVYGIRLYEKTPYGLRAIGEVLSPNLSEDLKRRLTVPKEYNFEEKLKALEEKLDSAHEIRVLIHTQPRLAAISKKAPDLAEYKIGGGTIKEQWEYAKSILGKEVKAKDVLKEGMYVDVISISKGKGIQGPVKRWGVRTLQHKSRKTKRGVGSIGPWHPARVAYTVPRAGQMGYHQRTEHNKRVLKIGENGAEITVKGGFLRYGVINRDYIIIEGTVPGPCKRLVKLRYSIRGKTPSTELPQIALISTDSKQGK
ncbi:MAG: 50S ribosomal protein L3 [Candidatus Odinarchaeia archaeon]